MSKIVEINSIYTHFREIFTRENLPNLFAAIDRVCENPENKHFPHKLGYFAILYTPVPENDRPSIMLLANNPSWFIFVRKNRLPNPVEKKLAENIVKEMGNGVPLESSYCVHDHKFAKRIRNVFEEAGLSDSLPNVVGMNWFWLQTGSNPDELKKVCLGDDRKNRNKIEELKIISDYCKKGTEKIINLIRPHSLFILGNYAREGFSKMEIDTSINANFAKHPDRSNDLAEKLIKLKRGGTH